MRYDNENSNDNTKTIEDFLSSLRNFDSNMLVIEEYKREMIRRQGTFSENE
jgi:hypothetical protein